MYRLAARFLALGLLIFLSTHASQAYAGWTKTGLWGDCCRDIQFDFNNPRLIYGVGGDKSVYRSLDAGAHWTDTRVNRRPEFKRVGTYVVLRIHPATGHLFYWDGLQIFTSTDLGQTWRAIPQEMQPKDFMLDPFDEKVLYACDRTGIYLSADMGTSWKKISSHPGIRLQISNDGTRLFVLPPGKGFYVSNDKGHSWVSYPRPGLVIPNCCNQSLIKDRHDDNLLYTVSQRTTDGGRTWSTFPGFDGVAVAYATGGIVYALGLPHDEILEQLFRSTDYGVSWIAIGTYAEGIFAGPWDSQLVFKDYLSLFRSTNQGNSWGIPIWGAAGYTYAVEVNQSHPNEILAQTQLNFRSTDSGKTWHPLSTCEFGVIRIHPRNSLVRTASGGCEYSAPASLSTDGGRSWAPISFPVRKFFFDPIDSHIIYALRLDTGFIMRTTDRGKSWTQIKITKSGIELFAVAPSNPAILYAVGSQVSVLYQSTDHGEHWRAMSRDARIVPREIAVSPSNAAKVIVSGLEPRGYSLLKTTDSGHTWQKIFTSETAPPSVKWFDTKRVLAAFQYNEDLLEPEDNFFYVSEDEGVSWHSLTNTPFPFEMSNDVAIDPRNQSFLAASERGVFRYVP